MFEKKLQRLEEIVKKMEEGNLALEESLKLFEEGVTLTKDCQGHLQKAEQKVKILAGMDDEGNPSLEDFETE